MKMHADDRLMRTAQVWWERKRPKAFTEDEHFAEPTINCSTEAEKDLAKAVADWLKTPAWKS